MIAKTQHSDVLLITRVLSVVDWCLKHQFPDNYDARCMYSAFGASTMLNEAGLVAQIITGDVYAFTVTPSGDQAIIQGFVGGTTEKPSHFWTECEGRILDVGPSYLPKRSRIPVAPMPRIGWHKKASLPNYLTYDEQVRYAPDVGTAFTLEMEERMDGFLKLCKKRWASKVAKHKPKSWLLTGVQSIERASRAGDKWAKGALRYERMDGPRRPQPLPPGFVMLRSD